MPTIYLIRHGQAAAAWGESADPGLSPKGREQARQAASTIKAMHPMPIVSSPKARARETLKVEYFYYLLKQPLGRNRLKY